MSAAKELLELSLRRLENQTRELETEVESAQATYDTLLTQLQTLQNGITTNLDGHTHHPFEFVENIQIRVDSAFAKIRDNTTSLWNSIIFQPLSQSDLFHKGFWAGIRMEGTHEKYWSVSIPQGAEILGYAAWSTLSNVNNLRTIRAKLEVLHPTNEIVYETSGWQGYEFDGGGVSDTLDGLAWELHLSWKNEETLSNFRIRLTHDYYFTPQTGFGMVAGQINVFHI